MTNLNECDRYLARCRNAAQQVAHASAWESGRLAWIQHQVAAHAKDLRKLQRLTTLGEAGKVKCLQARILRSFAARLCAELYEYRHGKFAKKEGEPLSWCQFEKRIAASPLAGKLPDPATVHAIPKAKGGNRYIVSPGRKTRVAQRALVSVMDARAVQGPSDFNCTGRGRDAAIKEIQRLVLEESFEWFVVFDLANFFSSVRPTHVEFLNLPVETLDRTLFFNRYATFFTNHGGAGQTKPARLGLPQGAIASGKIASALLGRELCHIGGDIGEVIYVDDGVIGVRTHAGALKVAKALQKRMANLKGGPIGFKTIQVTNIKEGFVFLGYWIKLWASGDDAYLRVTPSHQAKMNFRCGLHHRLRKAEKPLAWETALSLLERYRTSWLKSYSLWTYDELDMLEFETLTEFWVTDFFERCSKKGKG